VSTLPGGLTAALGGSTSYSLGHTAGDIINRAAVYVGLAQVADPYAETDPNFVLLRTLLVDVGQELCRLRNWTHLQKEYTLTTVAAQEAYDLPSDFREMIPQTGWNRTSRFPMGGPLSPQEWQYLKGMGTSLTLTVLFRPWQQQLHLYSASSIPSGYTLAFEYKSAWWVQPLGQTAATLGEPTQSSDIILFDPLLATRALRLAYLKVRGLDTTAAQDDYDKALDLIRSEDADAPVLSMSRRSMGLLSNRNIPITGFGS
jgi:hypothetical protein